MVTTPFVESASTPTSTHHHKLSAGAIAGIVIGSVIAGIAILLLLCIASLCCYCLCCVRHRGCVRHTVPLGMTDEEFLQQDSGQAQRATMDEKLRSGELRNGPVTVNKIDDEGLPVYTGNATKCQTEKIDQGADGNASMMAVVSAPHLGVEKDLAVIVNQVHSSDSSCHSSSCVSD